MNASKRTKGFNILAGILFLALAGVTFWGRLKVGMHTRNYQYIMNWQLIAWCLIWFGMGVMIFSGKINAGLALLAAAAAGIEVLYYLWSSRPYYLCYMGAYAVLAILVILVITKNKVPLFMWFLPVVLYIVAMWLYGYPFELMIDIWRSGRNLESLLEPLALLFASLWLFDRSASEKKEEDLRFDPEASMRRRRTSEYGTGSRNTAGTASAYKSGSASRIIPGYGAASRGMTPEERERQKKTYQGLLDANVITRSEYETKMRKLNNQ